MAWTWRYETSDGTVLAADEQRPASPQFPTQADAETWVGEVWRDLAESGVDQVSLLEDASVIYGPMSLHPA
jgi:hypothetical protein